ncbi:hypothetical protein [Nocardia fluminea]|uniref:hypothetical protein n=1 Tax=Nocardia fluminea TaxID=134984 RepID=UPI003D101A1D
MREAGIRSCPAEDLAPSGLRDNQAGNGLGCSVDRLDAPGLLDTAGGAAFDDRASNGGVNVDLDFGDEHVAGLFHEEELHSDQPIADDRTDVRRRRRVGCSWMHSRITM